MWRLSFTKEQKDILRDHMEGQFPAMRNAIKVVKWWNQFYDWKIPSFAIVCAAYWMTTSEHIVAQNSRAKWPAYPRPLCWDKVAIVFHCLCVLVAAGYVPHMFSPSREANVLPLEPQKLRAIEQKLVNFILVDVYQLQR